MISTDHHVPEQVLRNSLEHTRTLIDAANQTNSRSERVTRRSLQRLFQDEHAIAVTVALTDEVMRFRSPRSAAQALRDAVSTASVRGFGTLNAWGLRAVARLGAVVPGLALRIVDTRIRDLTSTLILDDDPAALSSYVATRTNEGLRINVNVLGEAVLGEREANHRLERIIDMIRRPDVNYVSVKLSAIVSQLQTIDHHGSLERVSSKLRAVYRVARDEHTFVNLDMEEFRDLRLTLDAFILVLSEPEFLDLTAGIVLQAYLPDSHDALEQLIRFSQQRHDAGGGALKVRLVKGANLAMEHVESELHGWTSAPYASKADVDASYLRLLDVALRLEHAGPLRVGVASHNLFHVAWALELARSRGVAPHLDVEMLEGMANNEARALVESGHKVLLYAPVTRHDDFAAAVAYLVRRLDENTSPENYLRAALFIANDDTIYDEQRDRFLAALQGRHTLALDRRRRGVEHSSEHFTNEPDGDPTNVRYANDVANALDLVCTSEHGTIDSLDRLTTRTQREYAHGLDPSDHGRAWYRYRIASIDDIDEAVEFASSGFAAWHATSRDERQAILRRAADLMSERRATTVSVMARDAGKTVAEADPEVSEAVDFVRYYAAHALEDVASTPLGVVLVVAPWNFPYAIPAGGVAAALAGGNAVILKPAPESVAVANELVHQLWDAGVPRDVVQLVPTRDDEVGQHLITHVGVSAVILTGSYDTARLFTSWKPTLHLLGETSGKNALVITASADVDLAVKDLVQSAFGHAGQKCSAASLAIVERAMFDDPNFLGQLIDTVTTLRVGPSYELATNVGPLIRPPEPVLRRALEQLDPGESWLLEPRQLDDEGLLWRPGVKVGVRPQSWSHLNEWFGPVLAIMVANDLDEAIRWQNATPYGLTAGLHSLSTRECEEWLDRVEAGNLYINRGTTGAVVARQPFGGWKRSSVGPTAKAGGSHYVENLRRWPRVSDPVLALEDAARWWREYGSRARDDAALRAERNIVRYRRHGLAIVVRIDDTVSRVELEYLEGLVELAGVRVELSAERVLRGPLDVTLENVDELVDRSPSVALVRWLSHEPVASLDLLDRGVRVDPRALTQVGAVELPRWLVEQSVAITNHRYGNVRVGPKPRCEGLDAPRE